MKDKLLKVAKIVVPVVSVGVTLLTNYLSDKDLDDKVAKKVSEALSNSSSDEA